MNVSAQTVAQQITTSEIQQAGTTSPPAEGFNADLEGTRNVAWFEDGAATTGAQVDGATGLLAPMSCGLASGGGSECGQRIVDMMKAAAAERIAIWEKLLSDCNKSELETFKSYFKGNLIPQMFDGKDWHLARAAIASAEMRLSVQPESST
ncbi:hypothetical protein [Pandoraea commovens]|uniref:Uncharacterized protein n=1 Tax=Pandoraea commovens TaxID=2508289 RepID=A0A5E4WVA0_9BURK|nr:hypothetical protein [Pandoraea commovens]VVE28441.1 hypothetical protein PCO31010_03544 [Pandoraea commovens]